MSSETDFSGLLAAAWAVREHAYAPYSHFAVGAALEAKDGRVFCGCNSENISFGLTICAERAAVCAAVAAGCRDFARIAVVAHSGEPVSPCGACRQVLAEFAPELELCLANQEGTTLRTSLSELFPRAKTGILG